MDKLRTRRQVLKTGLALGCWTMAGWFSLAYAAQTPESRAVYLLWDRTRSFHDNFADQAKPRVLQMIDELRPGDRFVALTIVDSFSRSQILVDRSLPHPNPRRTLDLQTQKKIKSIKVDLKKIISELQADTRATRTDIRGVILHAAELLKKERTRNRILILMSDLEENVDHKNLPPFDLSGARVKAMYVSFRKTIKDSRSKFEEWENFFRRAGVTQAERRIGSPEP